MGFERFQEWFFRLLAIGLGCILGVMLLEGALRLLPVNEGAFLLDVDARNPVPRFIPEQTFQWSKGWSFAMRNRVRVNNYGFINDSDYDPDSERPLLAVIGDSYVEALMVPYPETLAGRLAGRLGDVARVYTFAVSGAPLSQYLAYATYVRETFGTPRAMIVVVVGNDFDESLFEVKQSPGYHYFVERPEGGLALRRVDLRTGGPRAWVKRSALARYLALNLQLGRRVGREGFAGRAGERRGYAGHTAAAASAERVEDARRAVDAFLAELPSRAGLEPGRVLLVVDAPRLHLYDAEDRRWAEGSFFGILRRDLMRQAKGAGFGVIDMEPVFAEDFARHGERFEYPTDGHWNPRAHGLAAEAVERSGWLRNLRIAKPPT